jgi:hypothetical protein
MGYVNEEVDRSDQLAGVIVQRLRVRQSNDAAAIRALDDDFEVLVLLIVTQRARYPALIVVNPCSIRRPKPNRTAKAVRGVIDVWLAPPAFHCA